MVQQFKTVYYPDHPADSPRRKNVKLAFGDKHTDVYQIVSNFSSEELREILGHSSYYDLKDSADKEALPINTYCLRRLKSSLSNMVKDPTQLYLAFNGAYQLNPIHSTFRGGKSEPLHSWYPFLEGYSPQFVEEIIDKFSPQAKTILDPFAGTGTTPLSVARRGLDAFYCELNPLLQYLTSLKIAALTIKENIRSRILKRLTEIYEQLPDLLKKANPNTELKNSYRNVFNNSQFFDPDTFEQVLKARNAIDDVTCYDPMAADFLTIAVVSSLIPSSLLTRAGDLRFKTQDELKNKHISFIDSVKNQLNRIITDIKNLISVKKQPLLVCEDARHLSRIPFLNVDTIITSPPYLNGTNYFRNTKIELWFLRCLKSAEDLYRFRFKAVTAGINDVSQGKPNSIDQHRIIKEVVSKLEKNAYDPRIPKMVASYFFDMESVFASIKPHLTQNAVIAIDIGDSVYGGVHVPTDKLLIELLAPKGFELHQEILLRRRLSRNRTPLHQVLLVFRYKDRRQKYYEVKSKHKQSWAIRWAEFKEGLPHQKSPFSKRNWGHPLHFLCSYQGKMKPSLAYYLVKTFLPERGVMLDPFAGVGTIPFEAALQGHKAFCFEISPAARIIAAGKLGRPKPEECQGLISKLEDFINNEKTTRRELSSASAVNFNKAIPEYFEQRTLKEILLARRYFFQHPSFSQSECLVLASLLHILHGNRPYAMSRRSHNTTPFAPTGPFEYKPLIPRLKEKVERSLSVEYPESFTEGIVLHQDATSWWPQEIDNLDAIITSPPFFDSTRFHLANWLRLWFCGWERKDFNSKPLMFVDERQKASFSIYEPIFRQARERLKMGGVLVMHLGKSSKCDMAKELAALAAKWFKVADTFSESVSHCEKHGVRDKGTVEQHQYLLLQ